MYYVYSKLSCIFHINSKSKELKILKKTEVQVFKKKSEISGLLKHIEVCFRTIDKMFFSVYF